MEITLLQFGIKSNLLKLLQNQMYMVLMVLHVFWENKDVIDVTNHEIIQIFMKDIINQLLKNIRHVSKAKWHHNIFKMVVTGSKHFLPFITLSNVHQVVCST
jgi:hypothetical protein